MGKLNLPILLLILLLIPTFWRMLQPGIFSMHDFHIFRLYEYDKCLDDWQIPCRWAPDSAFEYGQPMFNFYTQLPYIFGEAFRFLGLSVLDSIKALFLTSLVLSALSMFLLSKQLWGNNLAALISALVYTYAPYRAVDVWVRGALPEALAFIFFPLITYLFNDYILKRKLSSLLLFALSFTGLILTHNLSVLMYIIFLSLWGIYFLTKYQTWSLVPKFILAGVLIFGLVAFYVLPVALESKLISIEKTRGGYYDFNNHFVSLRQLLVSRYWGYGASLWGEDDRLSLSVGHIQWILPLLILGLLVFKKERLVLSQFLILLGLGWLALWLTHNKSVFVWNNLPGISYIQFPWRFLGSAVFAFALACGALVVVKMGNFIKIILASLIIASLLALNTGFFFEDLWFKINDQQFFSGANYKVQVSSAIYDFWPIYGKKVPEDFAPKGPIFLEGTGSGMLIEKRSNRASYQIDVATTSSKLQIPIVYFPGWQAKDNGQKLEIAPSGDFGLITFTLSLGDHTVNLVFGNTPIRTVGNFISVMSFLILTGLFVLKRTNR